MPDLVILALFCVQLSPRQGLAYQRSSSKLPCDLDLTKTNLKINRVHLYPEMNVCAKFGDPSSILCQVIKVWSTKGQVQGHSVTLTLNGLI